ncbi:MFS transporter [Streptomyces spiralis]|uniref:MFS transporter n=1 Tax=Streptomyces spiralis TaxID=66376 RepID=UPI0033FFF0CE
MTSPDDGPGEAGPGGRRPAVLLESTRKPTAYWLFVLLVLTLLSEETAYAYNLVTPALPDMAAHLKTSQIAWVATLFSLIGGVSAPLIGKLADIHGKKRVLLSATGAMACGSLVVAVAPSIQVVLVGRALEGAAISILPLTYSIMRDIFPKKLLAIGVSIATTGIGLTGILAPVIAGALIDHFTYRGVFYFLAVFPVVLGALVLLFVPESPVRARSRVDWWGALLLGVAVGLLLVGLSEGPTWGWGSTATLGCFIGGVVVLVGWLAYERHSAEPLIDVGLLTGRPLLTTAIVQFTAQGIIALNFVLLSFLVQVPRALGHTYGFGASASGLAAYTTPGGIISMLIGFAVGFVVRSRGARLPLRLAFVFSIVGCLLLGTVHDRPWQVFVGYCVYAVGGGALGAAIPNLVIAAVPSEKQAVSAGTVNLVGALGASIFVQIGFVILNAQVSTVVQGQPIYSGTGFTLVYIYTAVVAAAGLAASLVMRHGAAERAEPAQASRVPAH